MVAKLSEQLNVRRDKSVFVDASTMITYGQVVTIFDLAKGCGAILAVVETDDNPEEESAGGSAAPSAPANP